MKKIIIGNWKMYPASWSDAKKIFSRINKGAGKFKNSDLVICPPAPFLSLAEAKASRIYFGGQNIYFENEGPFTGEFSASMLKSLGVRYVLLGHSERRALGETDELINLKLKAALRAGLTAVICVGEKTRDESGEYLKILKAQVENALLGVASKYTEEIVIAYEPVWAIGTGAGGADQPENFEHNRLFIKKTLAGIFGKKKGLAVRVLYGGSVNTKNAESFFVSGQADGLLVGRASLDPEEFLKIASIANTASTKE